MLSKRDSVVVAVAAMLLVASILGSLQIAEARRSEAAKAAAHLVAATDATHVAPTPAPAPTPFRFHHHHGGSTTAPTSSGASPPPQQSPVTRTRQS